MKVHFSLLLIIIVLCSCGRMQDITQPADSFHTLSKHFNNPPADFRTVPFWVWNDSITPEKIDVQLKEYKNEGFGGLIIHPRYGLITEYLGKEWLEMYSYAVKKARKLGLTLWIYDENSFPSGFAGGLVPASMPESYNQGEGLIMVKMNPLRLDPVKKYLFVVKKAKSGWADITADTSKYAGKKGDFAAFEIAYYPVSKWYAGYSYVDLIKPGVTQRFIDITMNGYEKSLANEFGKIIKGTFSDEPHIAPPDRLAMRWTPDLFEQFRKQWGYDLQSQIFSLFEETGNWKKVRHDYESTLLHLFIERWSIPWSKYAESKGLIWTGHYWEHSWPNLANGPDNMAMYQYHQMPGIDMLFNTMDQSSYPDQFGNIRSVKELASAANQTGRTRKLSETYGAGGWELTFEDMKRLGDWEYVLGVNFMNQHLSYNSIAGDRKDDFPQSFSYHEPWWKEYKVQADYFGRLSWALSAGKQVNRILVIEPTTTAWMYYDPSQGNSMLDSIRASFHTFLASLEKYQVEYDLGSENMIHNLGKVDRNKLVVGNCAYDVVILPPYTENLEKNTANLLKEYLQKGGRVISVRTSPDKVDGMRDAGLAGLPVAFAKQWISIPGFPNDAILHLLQNNELQFTRPSMIKGTLYHMHRELKDGQLIFLANSSLSETAEGSFNVKGQTVVVMDLFKGSIRRYPAKKVDSLLKVNFSISPAGSLLLFVSEKTLRYPVMEEEPSGLVPVEAGNLEVTRLSLNVLTLDYCTLSMKGKPDTSVYFYTASNLIWQSYGFTDNPWASSSQFKKELVSRDTFSIGTGFSVSFPFIVMPGTDLGSMKAVAERPQLCKVKVNGSVLKPVPGKWWLDKDFGLYDLKGSVHEGKNILTVTVSPMRIYAELEPVYILGDFAVVPDSTGFVITPSGKLEFGSWKQQGLPFYANKVSYQKTFSLKKRTKYVEVVLGDWQGSLAEVTVNGQSAGLIFTKPYRLDISRFVRNGSNEITVTVCGSLKNLLGPFHLINRRGIVVPADFKKAPPVQPSGQEYDQLDYGLMNDFTILIKP